MDKEKYVIYLRKSRVDAEYGETETLLRHEKTLIELAKHKNLNVTDIYKEIVSGDTIASRPVMQKLLSEVEKGVWSGVLVMEVERLARGDTIDQGIVAQTFKYSNTIIITPTKTYNPTNQFDEEYFEFGLFMSRREYKTINRRLQQGRVASVKEGNYIGSIAPYGYSKVKNGKHYTLEINPQEAETVRLIYKLYAYDKMGCSKIANHLNNSAIQTRNGGKWSIGTIKGIISNPVYIGKIRWNHRKRVKNMESGNLITTRPRNKSDDLMLIDGLHQPIISEETFFKAVEIQKSHAISPVKKSKSMCNPLSGLIVCKLCGHKMVRRPFKNNGTSHIICSYTYCNNVSSEISIIEKRIMTALKNWLNEYKINISSKTNQPSEDDNTNQTYNSLTKEISNLDKQLEKIYDFLEQGVYDTPTFLERSENIKKRQAELKKEIENIKKQIADKQHIEEAKRSIVPKAEKILETYYNTDSPQIKNAMLKQVIEKVEYYKEKSGRWGNPDDFEIKLFFRLPKNNDF